MQLGKVKKYDSFIDEMRNGIHPVPKDDLVCSAKNRSQRNLSILKTKGAYINKLFFVNSRASSCCILCYILFRNTTYVVIQN
jgi:hypothetical protein